MVTESSKTEFWRISQLDHLEILHATGVLDSSPRHTHETLTFGVIDRGTALLSHKKQPYPMERGCVVLINPDDVHACYADSADGYNQRIIYPGLALLEQATYDITGRLHILPLFKAPVIRDQQFVRQV
ncbi:MAG: AraC family ligand binding domain-containing protein [Lyngbya sp. HA4199-MV5]|nr:AraC family ligand binding domain-containing protein [Lyngbya sp. HA4199-MV5]